MPRYFPTVACDVLPGAGGIRPTVICAPLTASTRPSVSRAARTGAAGGTGLRSVIADPVVAVAGRPQDGPPIGNSIRDELRLSVKGQTRIGDKPVVHHENPKSRENLSRPRSGCVARRGRSSVAAQRQ